MTKREIILAGSLFAGIGVLFVGMVVLLTIFGLFIHNMLGFRDIKEVLKKHISKNDSILFYVYESNAQQTARNDKSIEVNNAIVEVLGIKLNKIINIDIGLDYNTLIKNIKKYNPDKNIIILSNTYSQNVINMITYIDKYEKWDDITYIAPTSTADHPYLNSNNVVRIYQRDNINTAKAFFSRIKDINADNNILLVDEDDAWASGLADLIEDVGYITRIDFNDNNIVLPSGSLNVILLSPKTFSRVFDILKDVDIKSLTLGDADYVSTPSTDIELQYLIDWNTNVMVQEHSLNNPLLVERVKQHMSDKTMDMSSTSYMTSAIQFISYLEKSIVDRDMFRNQIHFGNINFDENLNGKAKLFYGCKYTKVGVNANEIENVFPTSD